MVKKTKAKKSSRKGGLRPWKTIGWGRRILRVLWVSVATFFLITLLQVLLGWFINPPLTPLMIHRFFQQVSTKDRPVRFERDYVPLDSISNNLVTAVVYAEDGLFMYHHGFDVKQMKNAYRENKSGRRFRGGSTISQQTAKNAFLPHSRSMLRKALEAYYTTMIETVWGKRRIMEVYLNVIEFGDGIYGAEAASQHYFGHSAKRLSQTEAAQLAASLPAPLKRNPAHQTPFYRKQVAAIKQRFGWGSVNINMPISKRREKRVERETLLEFYLWTKRQK